MECAGTVGVNGGQHVIVPLRTGGKKMRKRRDLDAMLASARGCATRRDRPLLIPSTDDQEEMDTRDSSSSKLSRSKRRWWLCGAKANGAACRAWRRACKGVLMCACFLAACAAVWLFADVRVQLASLRQQVELVSASSKGVPEALQQCHETTRKLTTNQTILFGKTDDLNERLSNLTSQLFAVQSELDALKSKLKSSPELVKVPQQLSDLSNSVAQFGSQIKDLEATVGSLKDQGSKLQTASDTLQSNITAIQAQVSNQSAANAAASQVPNREDVAIREQLMHDVELAKQQIILTNTTLSKQLQWTNDEQKSNKAKLEALLENKVKVESQIATLEGSQSSNLKRIETLEYSVGNLTQELNKTKNSIPSITPNAIVDLQPKTSNDSLKELKPEAIISSSTSANITKTTESSSVLAAHAIFGPNETKPPDNATNAINDTSSSIAPILMKGNQPGKPNVLSAVKEQ